MNVLDFLEAPELMGETFEGDSWAAWRAVMAGAFALPMSPEQAALFARLAGGRPAPSTRVRELWVIAGRRSAKTHVASAVAVYLGTVGAALAGLLKKLSPGERGVIALLAVDRQQAKVALNYIRGAFDSSPVLRRMVDRQTSDGIDLDNRVSIEVHTNSHRAIRGRTMLAVLLDECAFYYSDGSASPDVEVYRAAIPGLATTGGMVIGLSSPYARRGLLWTKYRKHFGKPGEVLVVQGGTADFNPTLDASIIKDALDDDPEAARAEWLGQFRSDVEAFLTRETVEAAMRPAPLDLPYDKRHRYFAFTDPSGGGPDEFTLAIGHKEGDQVIIDCLRGKRAYSPQAVVAEYASVLNAYSVRKVTGDKYAGSWPEQEFKRYGIRYLPADKPKSALYIDALAALNSGRVELPPDERLLTQLVSLERRTARGGRDSVDHPPGGHDDRANVVAGLVAVGRPKHGPRAGTF